MSSFVKLGKQSALIALAAIPLLSQGANAATLFSTGFEASEGYASGGSALFGQPYMGTTFTDTITNTGPNQGSFAVYTYAQLGYGTSTQQAVQISDTGGLPSGASGYYYPNLATTSAATLASTPIVTIVGTIGVGGGSSGGASFGFAARDGSGNRIADVSVNSQTGQLFSNGNAISIIGAISTTDGFEDYELKLNYQASTYSVYAVPNGSSSFGSPIYTGAFEAPATTFGSGAMYTFNQFASGAVSGAAIFDNLSIATSVPEPASASLILGSMVFSMTRRRRRSASNEE